MLKIINHLDKCVSKKEPKIKLLCLFKMIILKYNKQKQDS